MPSPRDVFLGRPPTVLTARPVGTTAHRHAAPAAPPAEPADPELGLRYTAAVLASDLHPRAKRIALLLADRADDAGRIRDEDQLGVRALASLLGLGDVSVKTSLEKLRRAGFIRRERAPQGQPSRIQLRIPDHLQQPS